MKTCDIVSTKFQQLFILLVLLAGVQQGAAQLPVIPSMSQNGLVTCSNLTPGLPASLQWSASPSGPWQTNWSDFGAITADSNGVVYVAVPIFYRVVQMPYSTNTNGLASNTNGFTSLTNASTTNVFTADGMSLIPAGAFTIGNTISTIGMQGASPTNVTVSAFYMDTNLVSYSQWQGVYAYATSHKYGFDDPGAGKAADHPVQSVNWFDVVKWSNARSQQAGLTPVYYTDVGLTQVYTNGDVAPYVNWTASGYRLPTEAEWEKADRGGLSGQLFPWGETISWSQANYNGYPLVNNPGGFFYDVATNIGYDPVFRTGAEPYTSPVGYFAPNGYGLYDMAGNVQEWCWDWYATPYGQPTTNNPTGPATGEWRVLRGGDWEDFADFALCPSRDFTGPSDVDYRFGFRCVRGF
jgi:formylglycine-generating enzyme required for sulfatase activity